MLCIRITAKRIPISSGGCLPPGGLDIPSSGNVKVKGKDLSALNDEQLTIFRRRSIGFIFQNYYLVPVLNVYENIVLPVELDGDTVDKNFMDEVTAIPFLNLFRWKQRFASFLMIALLLLPNKMSFIVFVPFIRKFFHPQCGQYGLQAGRFRYCG